MDYEFQKRPCHELRVSLVWHIVCGTVRYFLARFYEPLYDGPD